MSLKRWAGGDEPPPSGVRAKARTVTLTPDEQACLAVLRGPKLSDTKRAAKLGWDMEKTRTVAWSLRAKLAPEGNETTAMAAKRLGL